MIIQYYDDLYIDPKDVIGENGIMKANFLTQDYIKITIKRKDTRVFNLIIDNIKNKNPIVSAHMTALHLAARTGCLSICKVIIENIDDLNPLDIEQRTPLECAILYRHNDIIDFIKNEIQKRKEDFEQIMTDKK